MRSKQQPRPSYRWKNNREENASGFVMKHLVCEQDDNFSHLSRFFARDQSRMTSIAQDLERGKYGAAPVPSSFEPDEPTHPPFHFLKYQSALEPK
ncbi:hypothetical protein PVAND_012580 [Polypedilum vanderplanki]|uniref:Uncharacterized protein n=1 Tax=Polypedilum vanderplanki TaxID=319348 RepID=A0A9J6CMY5_POLVA|nr:hypothetical protein PVAND_012580 [Polypedilum vanderplanki]